MLATTDLVLDLTRVGVGAVATFLAILLWSTTRDTAWMFVVLGTIVRYGEIMYSTFRTFGIAPTAQGELFGFPLSAVIQLILTNLPLLLIAVGFIVMLARSRIR